MFGAEMCLQLLCTYVRMYISMYVVCCNVAHIWMGRALQQMKFIVFCYNSCIWILLRLGGRAFAKLGFRVSSWKPNFKISSNIAAPTKAMSLGRSRSIGTVFELQHKAVELNAQVDVEEFWDKCRNLHVEKLLPNICVGALRTAIFWLK